MELLSGPAPIFPSPQVPGEWTGVSGWWLESMYKPLFMPFLRSVHRPRLHTPLNLLEPTQMLKLRSISDQGGLPHELLEQTGTCYKRRVIRISSKDPKLSDAA